MSATEGPSVKLTSADVNRWTTHPGGVSTGMSSVQASEDLTHDP